MIARANALALPLADRSVQCCVTSPPYWGLRDYGVTGQLGLERTPDEYVARMVEVFREVRRVLRDDGTLWLNLGDTYAQGGRGGVGDASTLSGGRHNQNESRAAQQFMKASRRRDNAPISDIRRTTTHGLKPKDLVGIPWRVAFALQADGWWLRMDVVWHKPNPMPEAVTDRPTKAHEYIFLLSKSANYFYDAAAIKERTSGTAHARGSGVNPKAGKNEECDDRRRAGFNARWKTKQNASFSAAVSGLVDQRNKRSVWTVPTEPFAEAHFAPFPKRLIEPCILAGCPEGGIVLDPFVGSGTTVLTARALGRVGIGFDLSTAYLAMAARRLAREAPLRNPLAQVALNV